MSTSSSSVSKTSRRAAGDDRCDNEAGGVEVPGRRVGVECADCVEETSGSGERLFARRSPVGLREPRSPFLRGDLPNSGGGGDDIKEFVVDELVDVEKSQPPPVEDLLDVGGDLSVL